MKKLSALVLVLVLCLTLALPVMAGYSLWKLWRCGALFTGTEWAMLALGTLAAFLTALPVVKATGQSKNMTLLYAAFHLFD